MQIEIMQNQNYETKSTKPNIDAYVGKCAKVHNMQTMQPRGWLL